MLLRDIRTPADVAVAMRQTAKFFCDIEDDRTPVSRVARESLATLLTSWAQVLVPIDRAPTNDGDSVCRHSTEPTLSAELEAAADLIEAERLIAGDGTLYFESHQAHDYVAWLREQAKRAAALSFAAQGFVLDASARREAAIAAGVTEGLVAILNPRRSRPRAMHPDDVAPPSGGAA